MGAARPAPAASLISAARYTLAARRCATRALCACVPGGTAAGCHRRLALRARRRWRGRCAPWRLRQPARRLGLRAQCRLGAARPGAYKCCPPDNMRTLPLGGGVDDFVRFALLETLGGRRASRSCRGRGWGGVVQRSSCVACGGDACAAAACEVRVGAARQCNRNTCPPGSADPRTLSARAPTVRAPAVRTGARCAGGAYATCAIFLPKGLGSQRERSFAGYDPRINSHFP